MSEMSPEKLNPGLDNTTGSDLGIRNFVLNLYRADGFENMAQAERKCVFFEHIKRLFRMSQPCIHPSR